jgi:hypothetical protein
VRLNFTYELKIIVTAHQEARFFERTPVQVNPISIIAGA